MKVKIHRAKIRQGAAVGSAILLGASLSDKSPLDTAITLSGQATATQNLQRGVANIRDADTTQRSLKFSFPEEPRWSGTSARRFQRLVHKRAALEATDDENLEFDKLQQARRLRYLASSNEIMAEWRRQRFFREILDVLNRNVSFFKPKDQARARAIGQTKDA
jgi:hypothetical protein